MATFLDSILSDSSAGPAAFQTAQNGPTATQLYGTPTPVNEVMPQRLAQVGGLASLSYPDRDLKYYIDFAVSKYESRLTSGEGLFKVGFNQYQSIRLPLPDNMTDVHSIAYDETPLGVVSGTALNSLIAKETSATNVAGAAGIAAASALGSMNLAGKLAETAGGAAALATKEAGGTVAQAAKSGGRAALAGGAIGTVGDLVGSLVSKTVGLAGYSPNQFLTVLLRGPQYKRHQFHWTFAPQTPEESEKLRVIIRALNNHAAPGLAMGGALFTFPDIFLITFQQNNKYLYKFKPAVLETLAVDYAPGGAPGFRREDPVTSVGPGKGGAPALVSITMVLHELEFWLTGQFNDENDAPGTSSARDLSAAFAQGSETPGLDKAVQAAKNILRSPSSADINVDATVQP